MSEGYPFDWVYDEFTESTGHKFRPMVNIEVKKISGEWIKFAAEIDSGSPISVFNESDCKRLGYVLTNGQCITLTGVFGDSRKGYLHNLDIKIRRDIMKARIMFTTGEDHKLLVGRLDVFDNFRINMRGKICKTYFIIEK